MGTYLPKRVPADGPAGGDAALAEASGDAALASNRGTEERRSGRGIREVGEVAPDGTGWEFGRVWRWAVERQRVTGFWALSLSGSRTLWALTSCLGLICSSWGPIFLGHLQQVGPFRTPICSVFWVGLHLGRGLPPQQRTDVRTMMMYSENCVLTCQCR
jgi:hypothetical protein